MRAAGSAGAGLKKLGKASAARLRQRALSSSAKDGINREGIVGLGLSGAGKGKEREETPTPPVPSIPSHHGQDSPIPSIGSSTHSSSHARTSSLGTVESVPDPRIGMPFAVQHNVHVVS